MCNNFALQHHPDLSITSWNTVSIAFYTHALGGLSINDFIVAAHSDQVPIQYSKKWLESHQSTTAGTASQSATVPASAEGLGGAK